MLASVLNSSEAIEASLFVVRAFIKLREFIELNKELAKNSSARQVFNNGITFWLFPD